LQSAVAARRAVVTVDGFDDAVGRRGSRINDRLVEDDSPACFGLALIDFLDAGSVELDAPARFVGNELPACGSRYRRDGHESHGKKPEV
jgi:hypothetical protein